MATINQIGIHPGMLVRVPVFEERARIARAAGFTAWGLRGIDIDGYIRGGGTVDELQRMGQRHGLRISDTGAVNEWQWTGHPPLVNRQPPASTLSHREAWRLVDLFLERSAAVGARTVVASGAITEDGPLEEAVRSFREICDAAARHGLQAAYEVRGDARQFRTHEQAWQLVESAARPNGGLLLDIYHFHIGGSSLETLFRTPVDRVFLVRLTDAGGPPEASSSGNHEHPARLMPGDGTAPLRAILDWLDSNGYDGYYTLEVIDPHNVHSPEESARLAFNKAVAVLGV
jgi:sugar phosphate isomerase/epimerase